MDIKDWNFDNGKFMLVCGYCINFNGEVFTLENINEVLTFESLDELMGAVI